MGNFPHIQGAGVEKKPQSHQIQLGEHLQEETQEPSTTDGPQLLQLPNGWQLRPPMQNHNVQPWMNFPHNVGILSSILDNGSSKFLVYEDY